MIRFYLSILLSLLFVVDSFSQTKSPKDYLGYELGSRFTRHHNVVGYFNHIAGENQHVKLINYGETYEKRSLNLAIVTSPENFSKLDEIRENQLFAAGLSEKGSNDQDIAIVWLSYNVHGNESVSTEVAMQTLFELVDPSNTSAQEWLKNTVVIIDPCINPDGRERYVNWYYQKANMPYNKNPDAIEHHEPWPGGRANHYLFDLNRDWAWATQIETRQRLKVYNQWMPHVHVDFHEQGVNSPYYFAPAAEPYHEVVTDFQREFQKTIGKNHARYFDKKGWLYFTKEEFDLLYPSYGDTYPMFNGAIGMTYEQGGSGAAGVGVKTKEGSELTLKDRIEHHLTTGLSTIEVSSKNASLLHDEYRSYFRNAQEKTSDGVTGYLIKNNEDDKIESLTELLDLHDIKYASPSSTASIKGYSYIQNKDVKVALSNNDLLISTAQPKSNLIKALFEAKTKLNDSLTYDITAWSLPYARGLEAYALKTKIEEKEFSPEKRRADRLKMDRPYAYLSKWNSAKDVRFLSYLLKNKVKVRFTNRKFTMKEQQYAPGTLLITRAGNENLKAFDSIVTTGASAFSRPVVPMESGMVTSGVDFGSNKVSFLKKPKIAILTGSSVSSLNFGAIWHFMEQQIQYEATVIDVSYISDVALHKYNVLVMPKGNYSKFFDKTQLNELSTWVNSGGKVVAFGSAISIFAASDAFKISRFESDKEKVREEARIDSIRKESRLISYDQRERNSISNMVQGSIFKTSLDPTNPLGFGYSTNYFTLKTSSGKYAYLKNGYNVGVIKNAEDQISGFAGSQVLDGIDDTLVYGVEKKGQGSLVYLIDDPLFRNFWENGKLLFSNAIFMVGNE
ncbi:M14 family metallopeptidase [Lutimonas sp.]|uniref:M14 family metallopeptidase n=1 Tax=Lutimonas sp. TaxID=1872403 RepID=UPI003D9BBD2B